MSSSFSESSIDLPLLAPGTTRAADDAVEADVLALFDAHRDSLLRYVCAFGLSVSDGEDLVQEVFLALFKHLHRGGGRENLRGWLFRVAHNLALKRRTRWQRELLWLHPDNGAANLVLDPNSDPEQQLTSLERRRRAIVLLNALPERDRRCVSLAGSGLRYREIAQVLGISLGSVAKSLTRALARLRRGTGA